MFQYATKSDSNLFNVVSNGYARDSWDTYYWSEKI